MGKEISLPQGPVLLSSAGFFSPQPPEFQVGSGPLSAVVSLSVRFNPSHFRAGSRRPFLSNDTRVAAKRRDVLPSRVAQVLSVYRCQRGAEDRLGLFRRAALHHDGGFVDVRALERLHRDAPRIGLAVPFAEL